MSDQIEIRKETVNLPNSSRKGTDVEAPDTAPAQKKTTLKGMLMMAICCAAPLLVLSAIPFLGFTFGSYDAVGSGWLSIVALLACPLGMYLMMRMMTDKK